MEFKNVIIEKKEHISTLIINHPPVNTFNLETIKDMEKALEIIANDTETRVMIITGGGDKGFSAGFDVSDSANGDEMLVLGHKLWRKIELFRKPVIACLNGFAFGAGCELALCCHFRIMEARDGSKIGLPELNLGMIPTWGGTQRMPRLIGKSNALDMILFSKKISPQEALNIGLVNKVSEPGKVMEDAIELAAALAKKAPLAVESTLKTVGISLDTDIEEGIKIEMDEMKKLQQSKDVVEGFMAFMEKREPNFTGQ